MITYLDTEVIDSATTRIEAMGLSTDTKPTMYSNRAVGENSLFLELDTKDLYYCSKGKSKGETIDSTEEMICTDAPSYSLGDYNLTGTLTVTFDGVEYVVEPREEGEDINWGAQVTYDENEYPHFDFSEYPFILTKNALSGVSVYCSPNGVHTISVRDDDETFFNDTPCVNNIYCTSDGVFPLSSADEIEVVYDGVKYSLTKQRDDNEGMDFFGAPYVYDSELDYYYYDFSEYPFGLYMWDGDPTYFLQTETDGEHTISITPTTSAVWTKYGEAPSGGGGIVGNLADGVTIHESDWIDGDGVYYVQVEPYPLVGRTSYKIFSTISGETAVDTQQAQASEVAPEVSVEFFSGGLVIVNRYLADETFIYAQSNPEATLRLEQDGDE